MPAKGQSQGSPSHVTHRPPVPCLPVACPALTVVFPLVHLSCYCSKYSSVHTVHLQVQGLHVCTTNAY